MNEIDNQFNLNWPANGLLPAIVQDQSTGQVLMLAYMNQDAFAQTLAKQEAVFWSRSRQEIWHKGATSGNIQKVNRVEIDCDCDTILLHVTPVGPACHTGEFSCFYRQFPEDFNGETTAID